MNAGRVGHYQRARGDDDGGPPALSAVRGRATAERQPSRPNRRPRGRGSPVQVTHPVPRGTAPATSEPAR